MLTIYILCATVGGILILLSLLGHEHGADAHAEGFDVGHGVDHDAGHFGFHALSWLPILSLRFWSFGLGAFGLTGVLLMTGAGLSGRESLWVSLGTGLVAGLAVAIAMRMLMSREANAIATEDDLRGAEADVTVAIRSGQAGRVRCCVKGDTIDLLAVSDEPAALEAGSKVVIVSIENDRARVIPRSALFDRDAVTVES